MLIYAGCCPLEDGSKQVVPLAFGRGDQPFRFLDLPADIRVLIYPYVIAWPTFTRLRHAQECGAKHFELKYRHEDTIPHCLYDKRRVWPPERTSPAILRVCRQVKHEALEELLKTTLVVDQPLPFAGNVFGGKSPIQLFLTSYISPHLLCMARRVIISIDHSSEPSSYDAWCAWSHFLTYLWFCWRESPPPLEHITIRIVNLPPRDFDRTSDHNFPTVDKSGIKRSQRLLLMLAGLLTTVPKVCDVNFEANASYEEYIRREHFTDERPLPPEWKVYDQLNPAPKGIDTAFFTFGRQSDAVKAKRRAEAYEYLADRRVDNNLPWHQTRKVTPDISPPKRRTAPKKSSKISKHAKASTHPQKPGTRPKAKNRLSKTSHGKQPAPRKVKPQKNKPSPTVQKEKKQVIKNVPSAPARKVSFRYNLRSNDTAH